MISGVSLLKYTVKPSIKFYSGIWASLNFSTASILHSNGFTEKPLVLMLPWFGATNKAIAKYSSLYENVGCDVLIRKAKLVDFLLPNRGLKVSRKFLFELQNQVIGDNRPLVIHSFSIGCYFYALMLYNIRNNPDQFEKVAKSIQIQIIDSPVIGTLNEMAIGISSVSSSNSLVQKLIKTIILSYFFITKPMTVKLYDLIIHTIKYDPVKVPSLLMTSNNDPMALPIAFNEFVAAWKNLEIEVTEKNWPQSEHAQHLKFHPELYTSMIYLLLSNTLGDLVTQTKHSKSK